VEAVPRVAFCERQTLHLDRGYDNNGVVRRLVADSGIDDLLCSKGRARGTATPTTINLVRGAVLAMRTTTTATAATSPTTSTTAREYLRISVDKSGRERSPEEQHADNERAAAEHGWALGDPYRDVRSASRYCGALDGT
jgi:hypothetical protein